MTTQYAAIPILRAVNPSPPPDGATLDEPRLYFNKELSWVDFNWRVLALAMDERTPLLERVKFVAITASNLDEFVQKRIGGLRRQEAADVRQLSDDGLTPTEQLRQLHYATTQIHSRMTALWENELKPRLATEAGIHILRYADLSAGQRALLHERFHAEIYQVLTPLAVDPGHPFPFISNLSLSLAVVLRNRKQRTTHFARIKLPRPRLLDAPTTGEENGEQVCLIPIEQLVAAHIDELFPGMEVVSVHPFRVTRNADVRRDEEEAEDLLEMISAELRERRFAAVVRLEVDKAMPEYDRQLLVRELNLRPEDVYEVDGLLDLTCLFQLAGANWPALKYAAWEPVIPPRLQLEGESKDIPDIFAIIRQGDLLVHHPYDSFAASTLRLLEEAAEDPQVLAIKQTLYRTSDDSPVVKALIRAAEKGKQVAVLVEVSARFDEANNIEWAQILENAGVHVTYGLVGLKTHTKATLIVRSERDRIRTYCHIGTGNYNPKTARLYTDLGLLTCRSELGRDVVNLFHFLTGYAPGQRYEQALVAPEHMRTRFEALIDAEIAHQRQTGDGRIIAKMNGLDDKRMVRHLYEASQAGVQIDLIIRGHCTLRPGLPGYSDNIRVISILGRFLEHDRIFYFHNHGKPITIIGSADWRTRNLTRRVELAVPVTDPALQQQLIDILQAALNDNRSAWELDAEGYYRLRLPAANEEVREFQPQMMEAARRRSE
ncbi:MAG TPA: polyphosphate kinase 1 [Chloroflexi bacterium]|nr:polyphosphate kinase 1 [Chloroflexota bacterium]